MKPVFRFAAAAWAVILLISGQVVTQEGPDPADPAEPVVREYKLQDLSSDDWRRSGTPAAIQDILSLDRSMGAQHERREYHWSLRASGHEARCWDDTHDALRNITGFCTFAGEDWDVRKDDQMEGRVVLSASPDIHGRVQWAIDAIRRVAKARVSVRIVRLDESLSLQSACLSAAEAQVLASRGRLVGAATAGLGDPIVVQHTSASPFVADYEVHTATASGGHVPVTRTLVTGDEFVAGAIIHTDGRVWVQGWHATRKATASRKMATAGGDVDLPQVTYAYTPISATIENGGGAIIDGGKAGRFVLVVNVTGKVQNTSKDCGDGRVLRLYNVAGALRGFGLATRWMMTPNHNESMNDATYAQVMLGEEKVDGPYNDAAIHLTGALGVTCGAGELEVVGPLLGLRSEALDANDAELVRRHKAAMESLDGFGLSRASAVLRIRAIRIAADAALPAGVILGAPSDIDLAQLAAVTGSETVIDRLSVADIDQGIDLLDARVLAHVHAYSISTATGISLYDPEIRGLLLGTQIRWLACKETDDSLRFEIRAGVTVGLETFEAVPVKLGDKDYAVEKSRSNLIQARFSAQLLAGQSASHVCPAAGSKDELLVFVATRRQ